MNAPPLKPLTSKEAEEILAAMEDGFCEMLFHIRRGLHATLDREEFPAEVQLEISQILGDLSGHVAELQITFRSGKDCAERAMVAMRESAEDVSLKLVPKPKLSIVPKVEE